MLIGINLLREGLDIPEVSLVAVLDADKEGFLRSERSRVQTCGRAARNADGTVILYADHITPSMRATIDETQRRRGIQEAFNKEHGIVPRTVISEIKDSVNQHLKAQGVAPELPAASAWATGDGFADGATAFQTAEPERVYRSEEELRKDIAALEEKMREAAKRLAFEEAAGYRDRIRELKMLELSLD